MKALATILLLLFVAVLSGSAADNAEEVPFLELASFSTSKGSLDVKLQFADESKRLIRFKMDQLITTLDTATLYFRGADIPLRIRSAFGRRVEVSFRLPAELAINADIEFIFHHISTRDRLSVPPVPPRISKTRVPIAELQKQIGEQGGARQPTTAPDSKSEGSEKPKPESEARSQ